MPLEPAGNDLDAKLDALERTGRLTRAARPALAEHEPDKLGGGPIADTLIEAREDRLF